MPNNDRGAKLGKAFCHNLQSRSPGQLARIGEPSVRMIAKLWVQKNTGHSITLATQR